MKKKIKLKLLIGIMVSICLLWGSSAFAISLPGPYFAAHFADTTFTDFPYTNNSTLGTSAKHPQQTNNPSNKVWGVYSLDQIKTVSNNNPESPGQGSIYYNAGDDGKWYYGVYGGLELEKIWDIDSDGIVDIIDLKPVYDQFGNNQSYLKIYEVTDPNLYIQAQNSGPNVSGEGVFGTFATEIINNGTLWLSAKFDTGLLQGYIPYTNPSSPLPSQYTAERLWIGGQSIYTGTALAFLDVVEGEGVASSTLDQNIFPFYFSMPDKNTADLKMVSTINLNYDPWLGWTNSTWTSSSSDPITGAVPEPATMLLFGSGLLGMVGFGRKRLKK